MSDIEQLLAQTGRSYDIPPSPEVVEADVRRGRSARLRRRRRRAIGSSVASTVAVAAIVGTAIVVGSRGGSEETATGPDPAPATTQAPGDHQDLGVRLVDYTGEQPDGFFVDQVPEGWYLQVSDHPQFELCIAENGDTTPAGDYVRKLVVMLYTSTGPQDLPNWGDPDPVEVNGQAGVITHSGEADTLTYFYPDGRLVQVQAWRNLGWSNDRLVEFAHGVTVTSDAVAGVG